MRDREFDLSDVEIQYGIDLDRDDVIDEDTEYFAASEVPFDPNDPSTSSSGTEDLQGSPGVGTIQYFVWDSLADLGTARYVTQDYVYTTDGRVKLDEFGEPVFQDFPGVRIRIRPISNGVTGAWKSTDAFDVNSNNKPAVAIGDVLTTPEGTVNEDVELQWTATDPDGDSVTISVDWVQVPESFDPSIATLETLEGLPWQAATSGGLGEGTYNLTSSRTGLPHTWSWDSVTDAGTMNGWIMFRMRPLDEKLEVGDWKYMTSTFHLDNYTIFTDPDAQLPDPSFSGRAVLLDDTTVLYTGGSTGTEPSATAAIFYPGLSQTTKGTVAAISGGMNEARMEHTATRLADGTVLLTGGRGTGGTYLDTAEIYDPDAKSFTLLGEKLGTARHNHTATLLRNGHVLICGGANSGGILASAEIYDPDTGEFTDAGTMGDARTLAKAVLLPAGRVLVAGGDGTGGSLGTVEIFDPVAGAFLATDTDNDLAQARVGHSLTQTLNDPVAAVVAGGNAGGTPFTSLELFDWEQDAFATATAEMQDARSDHVAVLLGDGKILLAGGTTDGGLSPTGDIFDVAGDSMDTPNGDMLVPVKGAAVACLVNGRPAIFGGVDAAGAPTQQVEIFTPDGGFNYPPIAQIRTPTAVEPWAFGVRFNWRATDIEGDDVRINAQFRIKPSDTDDSDQLPADLLDVWLPAGMKDQTVLGEVSSGVTGLSSRTDFVTELENPMDAPDVDPGEHLFIWYTENDIPKGDYDNVFFRIQVQGATPGTTATSGRFSITKNAPVIARVQTPLNKSGNIVVPFYLQDSDAGDDARVVWEYGIDLNDDGKIVEADFEAWYTCTRSPMTVTIGSDSYTDDGLTDLVTGSSTSDPNNDYTDANGIPWGKLHTMIWDSVYDIGVPASTRSDVILRCTPYDYPSGSPSDESLGIDNTVGGFDLERDPDGLVLESWAPTVNSSAGPGYTYTGVKLDEPIVLTFSTPVDPSTVNRDSIQFKKVGGIGERIAGYFHVDNSSGKGVVTYYPQVQEIPARTDIFEESTGYSLFIPGYDPANRSNPVVEQLGANSADTNGRFLLLPEYDASALETGTGVLPDSLAPSVGPLVSPTTTTGVPTNTGIELSFDDRIDASSVDANGFLVTTEYFSGVTSIVYGEMLLKNITEWDGTKIVQYAVLEFQPDSPLPISATIQVAAKTGLTDLNGNSLGSASITTFDTVTTGTTTSGSFVETFDDANQRDADLTNAFWGDNDPAGVGDGGGLGVKGYLTGMHELGSGSDEGEIVWDSNKTFTIDTDTQDDWEFQSLTVPEGHTLILKGSKPCTLRVIGDVLVEGTIDAAGRGGEEGLYYDYFNATSGKGSQGGRGGPGGGTGGSDADYTWKQTTRNTASNGLVGYGANSNSNGKSGGGGLISRSGTYSYDYYGAGGSGAGHANAGGDGTYGYYSGSYKKTVQKGGVSWGSPTLADGVEPGSGGGCGGSVVMTGGYTSGTYIYDYYGYSGGGGGGGGGGALMIAAGGKVTVTKTGKILANGGQGGDCQGYAPYDAIFYHYYSKTYKYYESTSTYSAYTGGGGGGSGGTIHVKAGGGHEMHGVLDVSGGRGGVGRYYRYLSYTYAYYEHMGGDGGDGRLKVDGPDEIDPSTGVNFQGVVAVGTATAISGGSGTTSWTVSGNTTVNTDSGSGAPSGTWDSTNRRFNVKDFTINSGVTLTVTGSRPFLVYASGNVSISGKIDADGGDASTVTYLSGYSSSSGWRAYTRTYGASAVGGGGDGGDSAPSNYSSYVYPAHTGYPGESPYGSTAGGGKVSTGWKPWSRQYGYQYSTSSAYRYTYHYYYFGGGSGGGGSAEPGGKGHPQVDKWSGLKVDGETFADGGTKTVDVDSVTQTSLTGGGGGAGGGRNIGYYYVYNYLNGSGTVTGTGSRYYYSYGVAGAGGAGGGAIGIRASGTITLAATANIDVSGGKGGTIQPSSYSYTLFSAPGGGGGGGNVLLEAKSGFSFGGGATINASGGQGGSNIYKSTSSYYDYGTTQYTFGGDGGRGAIVLRAEKLPEVLNVGQVHLGDKGSFDNGDFALTRDGVSKWQDSGTHAPDYLSMSTTGTGIANLYIEGAHVNPLTGAVDESTATGWIKLADLDDADGYRFFRFKCELAGSSSPGSVPSIDSVTTTWESKH